MAVAPHNTEIASFLFSLAGYTKTDGLAAAGTAVSAAGAEALSTIAKLEKELTTLADSKRKIEESRDSDTTKHSAALAAYTDSKHEGRLPQPEPESLQWSQHSLSNCTSALESLNVVSLGNVTMPLEYSDQDGPHNILFETVTQEGMWVPKLFHTVTTLSRERRLRFTFHIWLAQAQIKGLQYTSSSPFVFWLRCRRVFRPHDYGDATPEQLLDEYSADQSQIELPDTEDELSSSDDD